MNRTTLKPLLVINSLLNFRKTLLVSKSLSKNTGAPRQRNFLLVNSNKLIAAVMKEFPNFVTRGRQCIFALSFQTIILKQSLNSVLAANSPTCTKLGISAASKNIWICLTTNGKNSPINAWKKTKMVNLAW